MKPGIGVQFYSVRNFADRDFIGCLERLAAIGYQAVEFAGLHNHSAKVVLRTVKDLGLLVSGMHVPMPEKENINRIVDEARSLECTNIITSLYVTDTQTRESVSRCTEKLRGAQVLLRENSLRFALHNHGMEFDHVIEGKTPYEMIMGGTPELLSELDIYYSAMAGADTVQVLKKWENRIPLLHVKDGNPERPKIHTAVGQGRIPVKEILRSADRGILEWMIVELENCDTDMFAALEKSYTFMKQIEI